MGRPQLCAVKPELPPHLNYSSLNTHPVPHVSLGFACPGANGVSQTPVTLVRRTPRETGPLHMHFKITGEIHFSAPLQYNFSFFLRITYCQVSHSQSKSHFLIINLPFHHLPFHLFLAFAHLCSIFPSFKSNSVTGLAKCRNLSQYFHFSFNANPFYLPVQMKCCYFCIMSFIVWEIKKVRWGFLFSGLSAKKNKGSVLMKG